MRNRELAPPVPRPPVPVSELRALIEGLTARLADAAADPLWDAYGSCLEAAHGIARALQCQGEDQLPSDLDPLQEAMAAVRAAAMSVRFAVASQGDRRRQPAAGG